MIAARDYCGDFNSESTEIMNGKLLALDVGQRSCNSQ